MNKARTHPAPVRLFKWLAFVALAVVFGPLYLVVTMAALMLTFGAGRVLKKLGRWWFTASERMSVSPQ